MPSQNIACAHHMPATTHCLQCELTAEIARFKSLNAVLEDRVVAIQARVPACITAPTLGVHPLLYALRHSRQIPDGPHAVISGSYLGPKIPHDSS